MAHMPSCPGKADRALSDRLQKNGWDVTRHGESHWHVALKGNYAVEGRGDTVEEAVFNVVQYLEAKADKLRYWLSKS